jgi:hypothetical protein
VYGHKKIMSNAGLIRIENRPPTGELSIKKIAKLKLLQAVELEEREPKKKI